MQEARLFSWLLPSPRLTTSYFCNLIFHSFPLWTWKWTLCQSSLHGHVPTGATGACSHLCCHRHDQCIGSQLIHCCCQVRSPWAQHSREGRAAAVVAESLWPTSRIWQRLLSPFHILTSCQRPLLAECAWKAARKDVGGGVPWFPAPVTPKRVLNAPEEAKSILVKYQMTVKNQHLTTVKKVSS